jgi:hypothetical protein
MRRVSGVISMAALALLTGCASVYEGKYDWSKGWRIGVVTRVVPIDQLKPNEVPECQASPMTVEKMKQNPTWVKVGYRMGRMRFAVFAPVTTENQFKVGDSVYVNSQSCEREVLPRTCPSDLRRLASDAPFVCLAPRSPSGQ